MIDTPDFKAKAEYDTLREVMVHTPGYESFLGTLDPHANLFIKGFSITKAQEEHQNLIRTLRGEGIKVYLLKELVAKNPNFDLAVLESIDVSQHYQTERHYLMDNIKGMDDDSKFNVILLNPSIHRETMEERLGGDASIITNRIPLANMYFQRDQQFLGDRGFILSRMAKPAREKEPRITKLALESLEAKIVQEIRSPHVLEGGDFIPAKDFALIGIGYYDDTTKKVYGRTTKGAITQILQTKSIRFDEVGVVAAPMNIADKINVSGRLTEMEIMHLDTWFNIPAEGYAVTCPKLVNGAQIEVYTFDSGRYVKQEEMKFGEYLKRKDYDIKQLQMTMSEQSVSASNFLTLKDRKILAVNINNRVRNGTLTKRLVKEKIDIVPTDDGITLDNLTDGYGGAHCMTCVLRRS